MKNLTPIIKLCGNKNLAAVASLQPHLPDWLGFIFHRPSPRHFQEDPAKLYTLPSTKVGVFVNESYDSILKIAKTAALDYVQLHGDESPHECEKIAKVVPVIKSFGINSSFDFDTLFDYQHIVSYFLFDTKSQSYGGSGMKYDRRILENYAFTVPFLVSGGIDLKEALFLLVNPFPLMQGIDINSRFEDNKGNKQVYLVHKLIQAKNSIQ